MDCARFEATLLDDLYDEIDEVTRAARKRHAGSCARCAELQDKFEKTRTMAKLPLLVPPPDLEDRVIKAALAHAHETPVESTGAASVDGAGQPESSASPRSAIPVMPAKWSRLLVRGGTWAMRPQTAMAAVFLLMMGSSVLLLRGTPNRKTASMTVTVQGEPSQMAPTESIGGRMDYGAAASAHGTQGGSKQVMAAATAAAPIASADSNWQASNESGKALEALSGRGYGGEGLGDTTALPRQSQTGWMQGEKSSKLQPSKGAAPLEQPVAPGPPPPAAAAEPKKTRSTGGDPCAPLEKKAAALRASGSPSANDAERELANCRRALESVADGSATNQARAASKAVLAKPKAAVDAKTEPSDVK